MELEHLRPLLLKMSIFASCSTQTDNLLQQPTRFHRRGQAAHRRIKTRAMEQENDGKQAIPENLFRIFALPVELGSLPAHFDNWIGCVR